MKNPITKGTWYYETQILMFVLMWQHDLNYKPQSIHGLRIGRFHGWYDTAWLHHGFGHKLYKAWRWISYPARKISHFLTALWSFLKLYDAGFSITNKVMSDNYEWYRFFWKNRILRDFPDIVRVDSDYKTLNNGHYEPLQKETISVWMDELS